MAFKSVYEKLPSEASAGLLSEVDTVAYEQEILALRRRYRYWVSFPWILLCVSMITVWTHGHSIFERRDRIPYWAPTDFIGVQKEVDTTLHQVRMTSGVKYDKEKKVYHIPHPGLQRYVGEPSDELDAAWMYLIGTHSIFILPDEVPSLGKQAWFDPETDLYMGNVVVFHDLHCLNILRMHLNICWDYYEHSNHTKMDYNEKIHIEHCVDTLRQSIMCAGDMAVFPDVWDDNGDKLWVDFEIDRTCRNYDALQGWAMSRDSANPERYPQVAAELKEKFGITKS